MCVILQGVIIYYGLYRGGYMKDLNQNATNFGKSFLHIVFITITFYGSVFATLKVKKALEHDISMVETKIMVYFLHFFLPIGTLNGVAYLFFWKIKKVRKFVREVIFSRFGICNTNQMILNQIFKVSVYQTIFKIIFSRTISSINNQGW